MSMSQGSSVIRCSPLHWEIVNATFHRTSMSSIIFFVVNVYSWGLCYVYVANGTQLWAHAGMGSGVYIGLAFEEKFYAVMRTSIFFLYTLAKFNVDYVC